MTNAGAMGVDPAESWRAFRQVRSIELPTEERISRFQCARVDITVVADGNIDFAAQPRAARERFVDASAGYFEDLAKLADILNVKMDWLTKRRSSHNCESSSTRSLSLFSFSSAHFPHGDSRSLALESRARE